MTMFEYRHLGDKTRRDYKEVIALNLSIEVIFEGRKGAVMGWGTWRGCWQLFLNLSGGHRLFTW